MPKIKDILNNQSFFLLTSSDTSENTFEHVYATDLISMVIKHGKDEPILITQIDADASLGVAIMLGLPAVILTESKVFSKKLIQLANSEHVAILSSTLTSAQVIIALVRMDLL